MPHWGSCSFFYGVFVPDVRVIYNSHSITGNDILNIKITSTMSKNVTPSRQSRRIRGLGIVPQRLAMSRGSEAAPSAATEAPTTASSLTGEIPSAPRTRRVAERSNVTLFQLANMPSPTVSNKETLRRRKMHMTGVVWKRMLEHLTLRKIQPVMMMSRSQILRSKHCPMRPS